MDQPSKHFVANRLFLEVLKAGTTKSALLIFLD